MDPAAGEDAETMHKGRLAEGPELPVVLALSGGDDDPGLKAVVGRVELVRREELAVSAGSLSHGHDAAGTCPDRLQQSAVLSEEVAGILLLRSDNEAVLPVDLEIADGIAFVQVGHDFLFDFHIGVLLFEHKTNMKTISETNVNRGRLRT